MTPVYQSNKILSVFLKLADSLIWILVGLFFCWAVGGIYHLDYLPVWLRPILAVAYAVGIVVWLWRSKNKSNTRSLVIISFGIVFLAFFGIRASNDRVWDPDQERVADVIIENGLVTIENFRHCHYRSELDYDAYFETKSFRLEDLESVWFIVQRFTKSDGPAHVFLSFGLTNGEYFSLSVEIRRELGEFYSPIKGLYCGFELTHVIGDERDLIGVRTVHRPGDRVYMFRVNASEAQVQQLFLNFADRIDQLREHPKFYHTLFRNCANGITSLTYELTPEPIHWFDPRLVLPGNSAELGFEMGLIGDQAGGQSFDKLEKSSRIDEKASRFGITPTFSKDIRMKPRG